MAYARKPPFGTPLNVGHPLARDLRWALPFNEQAGARGAINRAPRGALTGDGTFGSGVTWTGRGISVNGTANGAVTLDAGSNWNGELTCLVDFLATSVSALHAMVSDDSGGGLELGWTVYTSAAAKISINWNSTAVVTGAVTLAANTWYRGVFVRSGSTGAWNAASYLGKLDPNFSGANLAQDATGSTAVNPNGAATAEKLGNAGAFAGAFWPGQFGLFMMWGRALSAAEVVAVGANPWQMWDTPVDPKRRYWQASGAAAAPTVLDEDEGIQYYPSTWGFAL